MSAADHRRSFCLEGGMTGGRFSRDKGNRTERGIVTTLQNAGFAAERVPLSGATRGRFGGDISVPVLGVDKRIEVKSRATGFTQIYRWLEGVDYLVVKSDRREPLCVLRLPEAIRLLTRLEAKQ
jgi:Holliday junction resolvase